MSRTLRLGVIVLSSALWVAALGAVPAAAGGGCHVQELTDEATTEVKVHENCFSPAVTRVDEGDRVTWFSGEHEAPHTVTGAAGGFGSAELPAEGRASFTFSEAGVYPYSCLLHPGMVGAVVVGDGGAAGANGEAEDQAAAAPPNGTDPTPRAAASSAVLPWTLGLLTAVVIAGLAGAAVRRRRAPSAPAT